MAKQIFSCSFISWMVKMKWKPCATNWLTASNGRNMLHKWPETSWINKINSELHSFPESESSTLEHGPIILFLAYFLNIKEKGLMSPWINIVDFQIWRHRFKLFLVESKYEFSGFLELPNGYFIHPWIWQFDKMIQASSFSSWPEVWKLGWGEAGAITELTSQSCLTTQFFWDF